MEPINNGAQDFIAILINHANDIVIALLTLVLAIFTACLWWESRKSRIQNVTPQISVYFYPITASTIGLRVENSSQLDARDVKIQCKNNHIYNDGKGNTFSYKEALSKDISYIASGQYYLFMVGNYNIMRREYFNFKVSFRNMIDKDYIVRHISIHMNQLKRTLFEPRPEEKIAIYLKNIQKEISSLIEKDSIYKGLRVYPHSVEERKIRNLELDVAMYRNLNEMNKDKSKG